MHPPDRDCRRRHSRPIVTNVRMGNRATVTRMEVYAGRRPSQDELPRRRAAFPLVELQARGAVEPLLRVVASFL